MGTVSDNGMSISICSTLTTGYHLRSGEKSGPLGVFKQPPFKDKKIQATYRNIVT